eukprot:9501568-Pyramimonas_sp.AAC.1
MKQREAILRPRDPFGCAVALHGRFNNFVAVPRSADLQFEGDKEFCIEAWISPNAVRPRGRSIPQAGDGDQSSEGRGGNMTAGGEKEAGDLPDRGGLQGTRP